MYQNASSMERLLNLSWDIIVIAILLVSIIYIFGNMIISSGIPQFYVENYIYTLASSIIGYQAFFSFLFFFGIRKEITLFGFPIIDLSNLDTKNLFVKIASYSSSSTFILVFLLLVTIPYVSLFNTKFKSEVELRQNKILIVSYLKTMLFVLFSTIITLFAYLGM